MRIIPRRLRLPVAYLAAVAATLAVLTAREAAAGDRFDLVRWQAEALPGPYLHAVGAPLRSDPAPDEAIARYFALTDRNSPEARRLENAVEAAIEARIASVIAAQGLGWPVGGTFPPVAFELASAPKVLVVSPRARIEQQRSETLRPDLPAARDLELERDVEASGEQSALVVPTGGVATFPAIVRSGLSYAATVETAAHEWVHHYLALYPLGRAYFVDNEARTINETVADLVGSEVAREVLARWPAPPPSAQTLRPSVTPTPRPDPAPVLRDLRLEVDALLAAGNIPAAEARMNAVRDQLAAQGTDIRRINQAYFAWYGTYAARPDSADPLGSQLRTLRQQAGSLAAFLEAVREVATRGEVARLLGG